MTLLEIEAVLGEIQPHIAWKSAIAGMMGLTTGNSVSMPENTPPRTNSAPKLSQITEFADAFSVFN